MGLARRREVGKGDGAQTELMGLTETEAVALISGGVAVLSAAVTGFVTYRITSRQIMAARKLALEERVQSRRAEAYLELFEHIGRLNTWVVFVMAIDRSAGLRPPSARSRLSLGKTAGTR